MKFSMITVGFAALAAASPLAKRQATVFSTTTYDAISISGGVAGNGEQEALDALAGLPADLSTLQNNINADKEAAGQASTALQFDASTA
ncbi:hypothetical protein BN1723_010702 [Verticillium longisporum]|uniref:Uncharacterized protein n=1 Tax=Verticillium longisporum TaxID=100787 RepID=A0A0G4L0Q8_VERLO|nr:hypothetical protein BN1723_010702 [Verticillium longisporum]